MAATGGAVGGLFDVLSNPAVSTPAGFALAVILYLGKLWLDSRKERRNDRGDRRTDESHIVEETKDILAVRREEMAAFREQRIADNKYIGELEQENRQLRRTCSDAEELRRENDELRE